MDENTITLKTVPAAEENVRELDLLDLLADCLLRWKTVLVLLLVGAVLGYSWAHVKNKNMAEPLVIEKAVEEARGKLSEDKAVAVEQLFFQYVSYKEFQKEIRNYYMTFAASDVNLDNTVQMQAKFYVSSDVEKLDQIFKEMVLSESDYQAMREIAPDEQAGATIYDRVSINVVSNDRITVTNLNTEGQVPIRYLLSVQLYGNSEEQCREMMQVVETAIRKEADALKELDPKIEVTAAGEEFSYNVAEYVQNLRKMNIDRMTTSENELNNLNTKVGKLSSGEKGYYDLLQQQYEGSYSAGRSHVSGKKWTAIGAFIGFVIAACWVFFPYLMNGKIQSVGELESRGKVLNRVFINGKSNLFGRLAARLIHADDTDPTVKAELVATDVGILMEKHGKNAVMLLCSQEDADAAGFAEQVKARLLAKDGSLQVCIGNPIGSVDELEMAAKAGMGVAFAEIKKSKRSMLREWRQICARYKLPLAGSVAVRRCW